MHILAPDTIVHMRDTLGIKFVESYNRKTEDYNLSTPGVEGVTTHSRRSFFADWEIDEVFVANTCRALTQVHPEKGDWAIVSMAKQIAVATMEDKPYWTWCQIHLYLRENELTCPVKEGGGRQCEVIGEHGDEHQWTEHTIWHDRAGNAWPCA